RGNEGERRPRRCPRVRCRPACVFHNTSACRGIVRITNVEKCTLYGHKSPLVPERGARCYERRANARGSAQPHRSGHTANGGAASALVPLIALTARRRQQQRTTKA